MESPSEPSPPPGSVPRRLLLLSDLWSDGPGFPIEVRVEPGDELPRTGWPIAFPLSLPAGVLPAQGATLEVKAGAVSLPSQVEPIIFWPDGSVQHLRLHFLLDLPAGASQTVTIAGVRPERTPGCHVDESTGWVDTGVARFRVAVEGPQQVIAAERDSVDFIPEGGEAACWAGALLDATSGNFRDPAHGYNVTCRFESGEVFTRVEKGFSTWQDGEEMRMTTHLFFITGQPWVRLYSWGERDDYQHHPLVEREIAFRGRFLSDGPVQPRQESRFGPVSRTGILNLGQRNGYRATLLLPWLRELGVRSAANFLVQPIPGGEEVLWQPISSPRPGESPMNGPCWVARYWREAALLLGAPGGEEHLAQTLCRELRLEGPTASLPHSPDPAQLLEERFTLPAEVGDTLDALATGLTSARLSPDYPHDGIDGQEWNNWESAYFYGFGWRTLHGQQPKAFGPRAMKGDGLHLLAWRGSPADRRIIALQARAWPVNLAPERMRWGFGFCDIGYYGARVPRGHYSREVSCAVPSTSNVAYAGRLLFALYTAACRTGEPMLLPAFERLYRRLFEMFEDKRDDPFDGDRVWIVLRDLVRLYQYTQSPRFLNDLHRLLSRLPQQMSATQWNHNYQCRFWNNESYALLYRLLGDQRMRRFHEGQIAACLADAQAYAPDEKLLLPMVATLPHELGWGLLAAQWMTAFAAAQAWEGPCGEAQRWFEHYGSVVREHLLVESPVWPGLHYALYPESVYRSKAWCDRGEFAETLSGRSTGWDTDALETTQAPGELFRAWTLHAAALLPYRFDLSRGELTFFIAPVSLSRRALLWSGGSLTVEEKEGQLLVELHQRHGRTLLRFPEGWQLTVEDSTASSEVFRAEGELTVRFHAMARPVAIA